jgi:cell wall-associated NlpC family hydrolase
MNSLIGIPYKFHGRTKDGVDCLGIVQLFYRKFFNISIPEYLYSHANENESCETTITAGQFDGNWKPVTDLQYGDMLVFRIKGRPTHVGVYLGNNEFLHCLAGRMSCIERLDSLTWRNRLVGAHRWIIKS